MAVNDWRVLVFNSQYFQVITQALLKWFKMIFKCRYTTFGEWERCHNQYIIFIYIYTFLTFISLSVILYFGRCFLAAVLDNATKRGMFWRVDGTYTKSLIFAKLYLCNTTTMSHFISVILYHTTPSHLALVDLHLSYLFIFYHFSTDTGTILARFFLFSKLFGSISIWKKFHEEIPFFGSIGRKPLLWRRPRRPTWQPWRKQLRQRRHQEKLQNHVVI